MINLQSLSQSCSRQQLINSQQSDKWSSDSKMDLHWSSVQKISETKIINRRPQISEASLSSKPESRTAHKAFCAQCNQTILRIRAYYTKKAPKVCLDRMFLGAILLNMSKNTFLINNFPCAYVFKRASMRLSSNFECL